MSEDQRLMAETFFLAVQLLDRVLSRTTITFHSLQLLAETCLLVARCLSDCAPGARR